MKLFKEKEKITVEEVHETFFTEVDRLLESAKILKDTSSDKEELLTKAQLLRKYSFNSAKPIEEAKEEEQRIEKLRKENERNARVVKAINYFSVKYPQYKFITEESVKRICEKYGLIYGDVKYYIGDVPMKNLQQIDKFEIDEGDWCYMEWHRSVHGFNREYIITFKESLEQKKDNMYTFVTTGKCSLEIAAPVKDFDTKRMDIKDFKLSPTPVLDPVVLCPVIFENTKYYLIVTAWGDEAEDELVVNEKMN